MERSFRLRGSGVTIATHERGVIRTLNQPNPGNVGWTPICSIKAAGAKAISAARNGGRQHSRSVTYLR
jgi:hypothetical protein